MYAIQPQPRQIRAQALDAPALALNGEDLRPRAGELGGLAARGGAQIRHALALPHVQQPRGQGGRHVLHPERATAETG